MKDLNETFMVDLCCGGRHWLYNKDPDDLLCMDIRSIEKGAIALQPNWNVTPDIIGDYTDMKGLFEDSSFRYAFWDIPHAINLKGIMGMKYGELGETWKEDLAKGFKEIHRILEDRGALILKFADVSISFRDLLNALDIDNVPLKPILPTVSKKGVNNTAYFFFVNYKPE